MRAPSPTSGARCGHGGGRSRGRAAATGAGGQADTPAGTPCTRARRQRLRYAVGAGGGGGDETIAPVPAEGPRYVELPHARIAKKIQLRKISPRVKPTPWPKLFDRSL